MLSVNMLQRFLDAGDYTRIVRAIAGNGVAIPLPLQARLAYPAAATALGLRRLVELTYGPTGLSRSALSILLHLQRPDGSFAGSCERDPLATAAAASAFSAVLDHHGPAAGPEVEPARDRALDALAAMQDERGLFLGPDDRTWQDQALTSAFVLSLLAGDERFCAAVRVADALTWFDDNERRLEPATEELIALAKADQPLAIRQTPALAAIAA